MTKTVLVAATIRFSGGAVAMTVSGGSRDPPLGAVWIPIRAYHSGIQVHLNPGRSTMKTLSLSEAKMKLSALVDNVRATDEQVVITKNGTPAAVLVSPDEFESWRETMEIRFDHESMDEIRAGLADLEAGRASLYTLSQLLED